MNITTEKMSCWRRWIGLRWRIGAIGPAEADRAAAEASYAAIVVQARHPAFYERFGVPDTLEGRFDMIVLHLWLVLRRLRSDAPPAWGQSVFNRFCADMDGNLREMGVGDLAVPKRMRRFGEAFYGRAAAYDAAMAGGPETAADPLAAALDRNVFGGAARPEEPRALAAYVREAAANLAAISAEEIVRGAWVAVDPAHRATAQADAGPAGQGGSH